MRSDAQLLRAYTRDRSQDAFEELVRRHLSLVYRSALRQLNADTHRAEDVAQMVFVALARQAHRLTGHPNLSAWLYTTTHRITCEVIRTEMRRRRREQAWTEAAQPAEPPSIWPQIAPLLDEAIRALGAREREAVLLRYFGNRSFAEIGEALAMTEDAARMRVNRSLEKLRDRLSARGVAVTSTALAGALDADAALGAPGTLVKSIAAAAAHATPAGTLVGMILTRIFHSRNDFSVMEA